MTEQFDYLIRNAKVFDGSAHPVIQDIAITNGKIVRRGVNLAESAADKVIDASGKWAMPGMFDIHTHYDLELEVAPGLPESVRHGTTTVVIANCSLGLAFGAQRDGKADPIVDCYARVENIPKSVLKATADKVDWNTPAEYLQHLNNLNLGPNVVTLLPHSMLRIQAMGFDDSINREPSDLELAEMKSVLKDSLAMGYAGFSTDALPFHYLANKPNTKKTIPTQFAKYSEIKALTNVVRESDAVWQATPPKDSVINTLKTFLLTSARLHGKPLKTTVVAALDVHANKNLVKLGRFMSRVLNSTWLGGDFHLQSFGARFKIWGDGAITPLSEEIPELRRLNETDLEERAERAAILRDPNYIKAFKSMWMAGKEGFGLQRLKKLLRAEDYAFNRELEDMVIDVCPFNGWEGLTYQQAMDRIMRFKSGDESHLTDAEKALIEKDFFWIVDEADFMLQMLRTFDTKISWYTITANRDMEKVRELVMDPLLLPGFNDSGAHLTNMAFYDVNLRCLQLAAQGGEKDVAYMVRRLTRDAAKVFGVSGGTIEVGDQADIILIDPNELQAYDGENNVQRIYRKEFEYQQLVNRSENVVPLVMIAGQIAWQNNSFTKAFGKRKLGSVKLSENASNPLNLDTVTEIEVEYA